MATAPLGTLLGHVKRLAVGGRAPERTDRQLLDDFATRRSDAAFAALVARHGPRVLRVCRRVLGHEQDAEDAFQATFLVLARNTASIRKRESVAEWLHGVAYRTALHAKRCAVRRRRHESRLPVTSPRPPASPTWDEVQAVLEDEVQRLPACFREAFVRCVLEGKGAPEVAAELGCKEGTVKSRVNRARRRLQRQLAHRGIQLTALLAALSVAECTGRAAMPSKLASSAVRLGLLVAAGEPAAGLVPAPVAALAAGVTRAMFLTKLKIAVIFLLALGFAIAGAGMFVKADDKPASASEERPAERQKPLAAPRKADQVEVSGCVVDADGKPVAGAKLFLCGKDGKSPAPQPATDGEGRFRFAIAATPDRELRVLLATADGLGVDWAQLRLVEPGQDLTLRLPPEVPIRGKVVDLEGKAVAGASVHIVELSTTESGNLDEFLKRWEADKEKSATGPTFHLLTEKRFGAPELLGQRSAAVTGADGKFRLTGIGRDRGVMLSVRAPGLADFYVRVVTRPDFPVRLQGQGQVALFGPEPAIALAPCKAIQGTVRDARTKQPLAGVHVFAYTPDRPVHWWWRRIEAVTDAQGRYRLDGVAKSALQILCFDPGAGAPHMHRFDEVADTAGFTPIVHDAELRRGAVVHGRVTDRSTGRPVRARVVYCPLYNNGNYSTTPGYAVPRTQLTLWIDSREMITGADGAYRLTALPGPGALFVQALGGAGRFTQPFVPKEERIPGVYNERAEVFLTLGLGDIFPMSHIHAYRLIRPAADATELTADLALNSGVARRGRLLDPDGRPVTGARAFNLAPPSAWKTVVPGAEFTAQALNPAKRRRLLFWHEGRKLAGTVVLRGDEPEPVTVTMRPLAALTGRAVRKNGEPLAGYAVEYSAWPELHWPADNKRSEDRPILTDNAGRFRIPDLPAGVPLNVSIFVPKTRYAFIHRERIVLEPDRTRALGDLAGEPEEP